MSEVQPQDQWDVIQKVQSFNELVKTISSHKRLDGADKQAIDELVRLYQVEKASYIQETKVQVVQLLQESLEKGYTVMNAEDYWILEKTLHLINSEYKIPKYQDITAIADEFDTELFSVVFTKDNNLEIYTRQSYMRKATSNTDLLGKFSLIDGWYTKKTFLDNFQFDDDLRNNNIVDMSNISASQSILIPTSGGERTQTPASVSTISTDKQKIQKVMLTPEQAKLQEAIQYNRRYTSEQIKTIQQKLWFIGAELDGKVWPKIVDAIRAFQAFNNIVIDGKAWPETFDKMWYIFKNNSLIPLDWVSHWTPTSDSNEIPKASEKEDEWKEKNKSYFTKNGLQIGDQVEFYPTWGNSECISWILSQDNWNTYIIHSWGEEYVIDDLEKSQVRKQQIPEKKWELQPSQPILENPWSIWSEQANAWNMLTDAQKKWIGWADPTDQHIISRMPETL